MGTGRTDEFRKDAVRIALPAGFRGVRLRLIWGRLVDLKQVGECPPGHGCDLRSGSRVGGLCGRAEEAPRARDGGHGNGQG